MAAIEIPRFVELCRLCATKITIVSSINIFETEGSVREISKKICTCLPIEVHKMDKFPKNICESCLNKLDLFYDFRESSARAQRLFEELYKEFTTVHNQKSIIVSMDRNELVVVQHHQILNEDSVHLAQLGQDEETIVKQEIVITRDNVDLNPHSLNSIDLNSYALSNRNRSNQSFRAPECIIVNAEPGNKQDSLVTVDSVNVMQQQHQLESDQVRLHQHDIDVNMADVNSENNTQFTDNEIQRDTQPQNQKDNIEIKIECDEIKLEDDNSQLDSILESLEQEGSSSEHFLLVNEQSNSVSALHCNICGNVYEHESEFEEHYKTHIFKCATCMTVFTNADTLNSHRKEVHGACEDTKAESSTEKHENGAQNNCLENMGGSKENGENRKRKKRKDCCFFCKSYVLNFARHMIRHHSAETEIQKVMSLSKKSKTRMRLLANLRKKGNFLNNTIRKPIRRSKNNAIVLPCTNCLGFYSAKLLWRHRKVCMGASDGLHQVQAQNFLVKDLEVDKQLRDKVFVRMRPDAISFRAKTDELICEFGADYYRKHPKQQLVTVTSRKMRELARLLIEIQRLKPCIKTLFEALRSENFEILLSATKIVTQYNEQDETFESASTALNLGTAIKQCCQIAVIFILEGKQVHPTLTSAEAEADLKALSELIDRKWRSEISNKASNDLIIKKLKKKPLGHPVSDSEAGDAVPHLPCNVSTSVSKLRQGIAKNSRRVLVPWTDQQKEVVRQYFASHIESNMAPKKHECLVLKEKHAVLLDNKDWLKIKVFVQNEYVKRNR